MFPKFQHCPLEKLFDDLQNKGKTMSKPAPGKPPASSPGQSKPAQGQPPKK